MPSDRHIELQNMAQRWLNNRAFKMCGLPELQIISYIADFVAIAGLHSVFAHRYSPPQERPQRWNICVFEVKVSRGDFLNTFGPNKNSRHATARRRPVGTLHWIIADKGVCTHEEVPDFWGLLTPYGAGLSEKKRPTYKTVEPTQVDALAFDLLFTGMNFRNSFFYQLVHIGDHIKALRRAVVHDESKKQILERLDALTSKCRGHAG